MNWSAAIIFTTIILAIALHVALVMSRRRLHNAMRPEPDTAPVSMAVDGPRLDEFRPAQRYDPREDDTRILPALKPTGPVFRDRKEPAMPDDHDQTTEDDAARFCQPPPERPPVPIISAPPEHSVNDYHKSRAQDQTVAQLAAQLAQADGSPWSIHEIRRDAEPESDYCIGRALGTHPAEQLSSQLNRMSNIAAAAGTQSAITGIGTGFYVAMGSRRITCPDKESMGRLVQNLNAEWWKLVADIRAEVVADLQSYATSEGRRIQKDIGLTRMWCVECSQTRIPCKTQAEAMDVHLILTRAYLSRIAPLIKGILKELAEATASTAKPSLDLTMTADDMPLASPSQEA